MVRLHLLGFTPDLKGLVFSGRRGGKRANYFVAVDDRFFEALEQLEEAREKKSGGSGRRKKGRRQEDQEVVEDVVNADVLDLEGSRALAVTDSQELPLPGGANSVESKLSPREIQNLLREGRSVTEVARRAEVEPEWIERFTGPVREERAGVIRMTRQAVLRRARLGRSSLRIGDAVVRNLESRKATAETLGNLEDGWDAKRIGPRKWRVRLRFYHRGKNRTAEWEFDKDTRRVDAQNKLGIELGWWPRPEQQRERSEAEGNGSRRQASAKGGARAKGRTGRKDTSNASSKNTSSKKKVSGKKASGKGPSKSSTKRDSTKGKRGSGKGSSKGGSSASGGSKGGSSGGSRRRR